MMLVMEKETKRAAVDLPPEEHKKLHQAALDYDVPATQLMREGIALAIAAHEHEQAKARKRKRV